MAGEAFSFRPWEAGGSEGLGHHKLVNEKGQWEVDDAAWGLLSLVWPKPDLLILGLGKEMRPLSPKTRQFIGSLGIRVDIQDTRNAAAQFNLLVSRNLVIFLPQNLRITKTLIFVEPTSIIPSMSWTESMLMPNFKGHRTGSRKCGCGTDPVGMEGRRRHPLK